MQQFNIDISAPRGPLVLYASQGDALSRFFAVSVTDNGTAYEPPAGAIYTVRFGAPGMPAGWYDTITEMGGSAHPAVVVSGSTITVELAEQAVSKPGKNEVVLIVSAPNGYTLASWTFELQVAAVPGYDAPEATVYYNALSEQVAQVLAGVQAAAASASAAAASAMQAQQYAESINPVDFATAAQGAKADSAVQSVNGSAGPAASVTTRTLTYQVGDTITTTDSAFNPNSAIGGTWVQQILRSKDTPRTSLPLLNGASGQCHYIVRNGWCSVFLNAVRWEGNGFTLVEGLPPAANIAACSDGGGLRVSIVERATSITAYAAPSVTGYFTLIYPVYDSFSATLYVWTKTA